MWYANEMKNESFYNNQWPKRKKTRKDKKNLTYYAELFRDFSLLGKNIRNKKNDPDISDHRNVTIGVANA